MRTPVRRLQKAVWAERLQRESTRESQTVHKLE